MPTESHPTTTNRSVIDTLASHGFVTMPQVSVIGLLNAKMHVENEIRDRLQGSNPQKTAIVGLELSPTVLIPVRNVSGGYSADGSLSPHLAIATEDREGGTDSAMGGIEHGPAGVGADRVAKGGERVAAGTDAGRVGPSEYQLKAWRAEFRHAALFAVTEAIEAWHASTGHARKVARVDALAEIWNFKRANAARRGIAA